jgi:hypothetical protein
VNDPEAGVVLEGLCSILIHPSQNRDHLKSIQTAYPSL